MTKCPNCGAEIAEGKAFCGDCGISLRGGSTGKLDPDAVLEGRYVIVKTIGKGGMGAVYLALDTRLNNIPVAVKEMSTQAVGGDLQAAIAAFQKEASLLIGLKHLALPRITDFFSRGEDRWYLVMDYIEGKTLKEIADQHGPIPEAEVLDWGRQLCGILDYLHSQTPPIIFRDLKPSNIMLTPQGQIKLIDFGIARHFRKGSSSDTAAYGSSGFAPPEQYGENQTDPRTDIYALGATLHYLLTGIDPSRAPFNFEPPGKHTKVSPRLEKAIMQALELRTDQRPKDAQELLSMLPQGTARPAARFQSNTSSKKQDIKAAKDITADLPKTTPIAGADAMPEPEQKAESKTAPIAISEMDMENKPETQLKEEVTTQPLQNTPDTANKKPPVASSTNVAQKSSKTRNIIIAACLVLALFAGGAYGYSQWWGNDKSEPRVVVTDPDSGPGPQIDPPGEPSDDTGKVTPPEANSGDKNNGESNSKKIVFNDPALEKAIREAINKPTGDVTKEDVKNITELDLGGKNIRDISGLECFKKLQCLDLSDNQIKDIEVLRGLTNLWYLSLYFNQINDIEALRGLINLEYLNLYHNQINDIEALRDLTDLETLILLENQISGIEALRDLTKLHELSLCNNQISDIENLHGLTNLESLQLDDNRISNIEALQGLTNLKYLFLRNNRISNIEALRGLTNLNDLYLSGNPVNDYSPVSSYYQNLTAKDFEL